jgi:hypothetical protein
MRQMHIICTVFPYNVPRRSPIKNSDTHCFLKMLRELQSKKKGLDGIYLTPLEFAGTAANQSHVQPSVRTWDWGPYCAKIAAPREGCLRRSAGWGVSFEKAYQ